MRLLVLSNDKFTVKARSIVCLLLFFLSFLSTTIMASNMVFGHGTSQIESHQMSNNDNSHCHAESSNSCSDNAISSESHNHEDCAAATHCSGFSGLLVSNHIVADSATLSLLNIELPFYTSISQKTPYTPPIFSA